MRASAGLTVSLLGALMLSCPCRASAEADQAWQACIGATSSPDDRVSACSSVIFARAETGRWLAAALCNRGHGLTEKHELDSALADLDEAIRLDPDYACAYTNRGRIFAFKREVDRAMADYDRAIGIDPGFALAYNNKGGLADYDKAVQYDPADVFSWNNRGQARLRLGDKAGSIADFRKALQLRPNLRRRGGPAATRRCAVTAWELPDYR